VAGRLPAAATPEHRHSSTLIADDMLSAIGSRTMGGMHAPAAVGRPAVALVRRLDGAAEAL